MPPVTAYCSGDGTATPCPCANSGDAGKGCDNSFATGGGLLVSTGFPSVATDTLVLSVSGVPNTSPGLYFQGETQQNGGLGVPFGDAVGLTEIIETMPPEPGWRIRRSWDPRTALP